MRTVLLTTTALIALATPAVSADLRAPVYKAPPAVPAWSWTGCFAGGHAGSLWTRQSWTNLTPGGDFFGAWLGGHQANSWLGGVQAGYNFQNGPWVFGVEGDIQAAGADGTFAPWKFSNPWFGTLRGRAGYAFSNILFYGTAGLAFGELRAQTFGWTESHTTAGWTAGVGAEVGFAPNWSAKLEYLYVDLSSSQFAITGVSNGYSASVVRAGVNYHF